MEHSFVIIILLLLRLVPLIVTVMVANKKHRRVWLWLLLAFLLPIPVMIAILILPPVVPCKKCQQCKRYSWESTESCPYCNIPMPDGPIEQAPDPAHNASRSMLNLILLFFLVLVVPLLGILSAIAIPKFTELIKLSKESQTKGHLGAIRSALVIYYSDTEGKIPKTLNELTVNGQYLKEIPKIEIPRNSENPGHPLSDAVTYGKFEAGVTDEGGWFYDNSEDTVGGKIAINCTHKDSRGTRWDQH